MGADRRGRSGRGGSRQFEEQVQIYKDVGHPGVVGRVRTAWFSSAQSPEEGGVGS